MPMGIHKQMVRPGTWPRCEKVGSDGLKECAERPCQWRGEDSPFTHVVVQRSIQTIISHVGKDVQHIQLLE